MRERIKELVQQTLHDFLHTTNTETRKDILILLVYESSNPTLVLENIKALSDKHHVTLCVGHEWEIESQANTKVIRLEDCKRQELQQLLDQIDVLYVPAISHGLIAKISLLIDDDIPSWLVMQTQLKGKEVIIANDQMPAIGSSIFFMKPSIEKRIQTYWRQMREDGIHAIPMAKVPQKITRVSKKKPVVLAKHIEKLAVDGEKEVTLPKGSILTPMGKDIARELGITVNREHDEKRDQK
ncbi:hypothetical protein ACFQ3N_17340 [Virgibacillus byunsanensis]|uniref:Flavoprotein domain-containing protein n=1 Tax=Virgibacillus byunsanensis TaxID=570945 RepID=A0ABW3LP02_9BACI